ncbi:MAG: AlpA family transcriptional regulator [Burkholderiaceae bacterium]|nr:AlpA family transcriptional regulator [Burkholderiaceae bacterium]
MPHPNASFRVEHPVSAADLLRLPAVVRQTGLSRSTIYRLMATRHFPLPVKLTNRAVGWRRSDVDRWSNALPPAAH